MEHATSPQVPQRVLLGEASGAVLETFHGKWKHFKLDSERSTAGVDVAFNK